MRSGCAAAVEVSRRRGVVDVDVDQLRPSGLPNVGVRSRSAHAERERCRRGVEHLELLDVERAVVEVAGRRIARSCRARGRRCPGRRLEDHRGRRRRARRPYGVASAVAPLGFVATMLSSERPPISGTSIEKEPSGAAVPVRCSSVSSSTFVAAIRIVLPGAEVPGHGHRARDDRAVGRRGHGQRRLALRVADVAIERVARAVEHLARRRVERQPHELAGRPRQRRGRAGRLAVRRSRSTRSSGSVPNGERARSAASHACSAIRPDAGGHVAHRLQARDGRAGHRRGRARTGRARRPARATGGRCPGSSAPTGGRRSAVAVAVAVVAQEALAARGALADESSRRRRSDATMSGSSSAITPRRTYSRKPASMTGSWSRSGPPLPTL